jgi:hypothetical protein
MFSLFLTMALNGLIGLAPGRGTETMTEMFPMWISETLGPMSDVVAGGM